MIVGILIGLVIGFVIGWLVCAFNATTPCPDCNEVAPPCGDKK